MIGCSKTLNNEIEDNVADSSEKISDFSMLEGVWVNMDTTTSISFDAYVIGSNTIQFITYPGEAGREGHIENITQSNEDIYCFDLIYYEEDYYGEILPEEKWQVSLKYDETNSTISFDSDNFESVWTLKGSSIEDANTNVFSTTTEQNTTSNYNLPYIDCDCTDMDSSIRELIAYYNLEGPNPSFCDMIEADFDFGFGMKNYDNVDCYCDLSYGSNYFVGADSRGIRFFCTWGNGARVVDVLPRYALDITPAVFTIDNNRDAYIWQTRNCYLCLIVASYINGDYLNKDVLRIIYSKDLNYLPFVSY